MKREKSERELLADIGKKLDHVIGLLTIQQSDADENAKIKLLYDLGLEPDTIASILGLSPSAVMSRMSRMRKKAASTRK